MDPAAVLDRVSRLAPSAEPRAGSDTPAVRVRLDHLTAVLQNLRDDAETAFDMLFDHTAIDWPERGCFELIYRLYSTRHGHALVVTVEVPRSAPVAPTVCGLWPGAEWLEREAYDLFGICYDDHPDLRRVFLDDDWSGHPLRKDYEDPDMLAAP